MATWGSNAAKNATMALLIENQKLKEQLKISESMLQKANIENQKLKNRNFEMRMRAQGFTVRQIFGGANVGARRGRNDNRGQRRPQVGGRIR